MRRLVGALGPVLSEKCCAPHEILAFGVDAGVQHQPAMAQRFFSELSLSSATLRLATVLIRDRWPQRVRIGLVDVGLDRLVAECACSFAPGIAAEGQHPERARGLVHESGEAVFGGQRRRDARR